MEYISWYLSLDDQRLANSYEECVRNFYILDELNKTLARCNTASGVESESEQKPKSDMSAHYVKKFEELYEVFNNRVGGKRKIKNARTLMLIEQPPLILRMLYPRAFWRMDKHVKAVYLTFDDGPIPEITPWVLDLLDKYNIKATFFLVGDNVRKHPEEFKMIVDRGHRLGNHTF